MYYNREDLVTDSINSVVEQLNNERELILIDDGSTDGTYEKLKQFSSFNVTVIKKENSGFTNSIIEGINISKGEYIAIHGSGDISLPSRFSLQEKCLDDDSKIGLCATKVETAESKEELNKVYISGSGFVGCATSKLLSSNFIVHGSVMFRKHLYDKVGGYRRAFTFAQDRDLWIRLSRITDFKVIDKVLYKKFKIVEGGVSANPTKIFQQRLFSNFAVALHRHYVSKGVDLEVEYGLIGSMLIHVPFNVDIENLKVYFSISKRFGVEESSRFLQLIRRGYLTSIAYFFTRILVKLGRLSDYQLKK